MKPPTLCFLLVRIMPSLLFVTLRIKNIGLFSAHKILKMDRAGGLIQHHVSPYSEHYVKGEKTANCRIFSYKMYSMHCDTKQTANRNYQKKENGRGAKNAPGAGTRNRLVFLSPSPTSHGNHLESFLVYCLAHIRTDGRTLFVQGWKLALNNLCCSDEPSSHLCI